ncbi:MAG: DNA-processing protein DprA [Pseudomonadota bacterium]
MNQDTRIAWLTLLSASGVGNAALRPLLAQFSSAEHIVNASDALLSQSGLTSGQVHAIRDADPARIANAQRWLQHERHDLITINDTHYPDSLRELPDAPVALFAVGDPTLLRMPSLAIVGSRNPTSGGADNAEQFARYIAGKGLAIVSGLASGIDAAAHRGALAANGATIAVLGNGPDQSYPASNRALQHDIGVHGLVLSEYLPGHPPGAGQFPARNRIISGLSLGVLVVEATKRSGSLITARMAGEPGRSVFAIPGSIHNPLARGCHQLIRQGALLVEQADDIFLDLGARLAPFVDDAEPADDPQPVNEQPEASEDYVKLLDSMGWDPVSVDTLATRTALTAAELSSMLLILELDGRVASVPGGGFARCR